MAVTQAFTNQAKQDFLAGIHNRTTDTFKLALFVEASAGTLDKTTTGYTVGMSGELPSLNGYTQGGKELSSSVAVNNTVGLAGDVAYLDFTSNPSWEGASFTCDCALIYNDSKTNTNGSKKVLAIFKFAPITVNNGAFLVEFPAPGANAVIRIA